jgi:hypothetical protein
MGKIADYLKYYNIYYNIPPTVNGYTSAVCAFIDFICGKQRRERWLNLRGFNVVL